MQTIDVGTCIFGFDVLLSDNRQALPANQYDWGIADPMAAPSRLNYRGGGTLQRNVSRLEPPAY